MRSLAAAQRSDPGFDAHHLGLVSFDLSLQGYDKARGKLFTEQVLARVGALPGVAHVTLALSGPLAAGMLRSVFPEGQAGGRGTLVLVNAVSVLALVLAAVGIYGVMSDAVSQRAPEIGLRMAPGAERGSVLGLVLRQGMQVVGLGLVVGAAVTLALSRLVGVLLFVSPGDPAVYAAMGAALASVGAVANLFPARRAATVDPLVALRAE